MLSPGRSAETRVEPTAITMLQALAEVVVEVLCVMTGHGLLWVLTLGRWKAIACRDGLATVVGLLFWVGIGAGLTLILMR
jgi:hypothetical protein